jgi:prevent-host-death family protein
MTRRSGKADLGKSQAQALPALQLKEFTVSITEAKADFDRLLRRVRRGRVACITRYGKPWACLISVRDYRELMWQVATVNLARIEP